MDVLNGHADTGPRVSDFAIRIKLMDPVSAPQAFHASPAPSSQSDDPDYAISFLRLETYCTAKYDYSVSDSSAHCYIQ